MKRSELKKIIKPIVLECIKESLFEEGVLGGVISEVVKGLGTAPLVEHAPPTEEAPRSKPTGVDRKKIQQSKNKIMEAIGKDAYNGVDLFEGTTPAAPPSNTNSKHGALKDLDPNDAGVDISTIFNSNWGKLV